MILGTMWQELYDSFEHSQPASAIGHCGATVIVFAKLIIGMQQQ